MDYKNLELSYVVPIFQDNDDVNDIEKIVNIYSKYSSNIKQKTHFIFVDDCSPTKINISNKELNFTLARIHDDIEWNQAGARNLGVHLSKTPKLILTDLDHIFPEKILEELIKTRIPKSIYRFKRIQDNKSIYRHINTFFCSKYVFYKTLGVDEDFAGHYGCEDTYFIELQKHLGTRFKMYRKGSIIAYDNQHHSLKRDTTYNSHLLEKKMNAIKNNNAFSAHSRKFLNFNWSIVETNWLDNNA